MFIGSAGKIATTVCTTTTSARFSPRSHKELKDAVTHCLRLSAVGDCSKGVHGPIGDWDVSAVTDMRSIFAFANAFNADISKWDVAAVTDMSWMFHTNMFHKSSFAQVKSRSESRI